LLNQHIYNLKIEKEEEKEFTHRYVNWILPEIRREIEGGAGQLHLTKDKIESINIPFPKEKELLRINERLSAFEKLVETENEYVNKLRAQKKALMQDLLTGKVRVDSLIEIKK
ncbi:MAG: restriction endonuclease subunit S, partial [Saprospiraceae bacterium]|nr:restriction endonuclease subunit S [Saprospiraceae bacterium]